MVLCIELTMHMIIFNTGTCTKPMISSHVPTARRYLRPTDAAPRSDHMIFSDAVQKAAERSMRVEGVFVGSKNAIHEIIHSWGALHHHVLHHTKCRSVRYCSESCQRQHWPDHKAGCFDYAKDSACTVVQLGHPDKPSSTASPVPMAYPVLVTKPDTRLLDQSMSGLCNRIVAELVAMRRTKCCVCSSVLLLEVLHRHGYESARLRLGFAIIIHEQSAVQHVWVETSMGVLDPGAAIMQSHYGDMMPSMHLVDLELPWGVIRVDQDTEEERNDTNGVVAAFTMAVTDGCDAYWALCPDKGLLSLRDRCVGVAKSS